MNTVAIIQVRLGSTRLPRKALARIGNYPSFYHVYARAKYALGTAIIACPAKDQDELAAACPPDTIISSVPAPENDGLARTYKTAVLNRADVILRVTGDCVFTDPDTIRGMVDNFTGGYAENEPSQVAYHGLEVQVFDMENLEEAHLNATKPEDREHTVPYMRRKFGYGESRGKDSTIFRAHIRCVLDRQADLDFMRAIAAIMDTEPPNPSVQDIVAAVNDGRVQGVFNEQSQEVA